MGRARGRGTTIRVGKTAFPNAPPPTPYRRGSVQLKRGKESNESTSEHKRPKNAEFGCYINPTTRRTVINHGSSSERVVSHGRVMDTSAVNIDLGFKPPSLKFRETPSKRGLQPNQLHQQQTTLPLQVQPIQLHRQEA